jgi:hypothetical protein
MSNLFLVNEVKKQAPKKTVFYAIACIVIIAFGMFVVAPLAAAHTPAWNIPTWSYISLAPNPVGVNQPTIVAFWLDVPPPTANGQYGDRWQNLTLTVTKPDGTVQKLGPFTSDPVGSSYTVFSPDTVGKYTFVFNFPGQILSDSNRMPGSAPSPYAGDYYMPSISDTATLVVQTQQVTQYPAAQLPSGYWQRPVYGENREWYTIAGNWLGTGLSSRGASFYDSANNYAPYTTAPNTAHIIWTKPIAFGGLIGGEAGGGGTSEYYTGSAYEPMLRPPVIIQGKLYYNQPNPPRYGFYCVDLRTGQTNWFNNGTNAPQYSYSASSYAYPGITNGQILNYISPNQYGGIPYLWYVASPNYYMYDAFTGNWILTLTNSSTGTIVMDPNGNMLVYVFNAARGWLAMWNSTLAIPWPTSQSNGYWLWRPQSGIFDWRNGVQWNVTIANVTSQAVEKISGNTIWVRSSVLATSTTPNVVDIGYSTIDGHMMWMQNRTGDQANTIVPGTYAAFGGAGFAAGDGVYVVFNMYTMQWYGYDLNTGNYLWGPTKPYTNDWDIYNDISYIAYDKLYAQALSGVYCFDIHTGKQLWYWTAGSTGLETAYGVWPTEAGGMLIADGKVFIPVAHTHLQPLFRGAQLYAIDANTGQGLWNVSGWFACASSSQQFVIADGYLVGVNSYDNQLYAFGKGLTATTVTASPPIGGGPGMLLQGSVTDQSPGNTSLGIPAAGTPAVSDASMTQWMEYLYMQKPKPTNATGVQVTLTAIDPNGNLQIIGNATTDITGRYSIPWTPPVPGVYTVTASYGGSQSYFASTSETSFLLSPASTTHASVTSTPTTQPTTAPPTATIPPMTSPSPSTAPSPTSQATTMLYVAIAAAVIIVAIVAAAIVLKKRQK